MGRPADVRFLKSHEWARLADGEVAVGISDFAVDQLNKEIVYIELPQAGRQIKKGDTFGVIESVKAASDLYAPVSGTISSVNDAVAENPSLVGEDPYGNGWLIKIKPDAESTLDDLLSGEDYDKHAAEEAH